MTRIPKPPPELSPTGKKLWRAILAEWPITDSVHLAVLRTALESLDRADRCRAIVDREGEVIKDRFGQAKPHPLLAAERDARSSFLQAVKTLGLDPTQIEV